MKTIVFDCETNGLLPTVTKLHGLVLYHVEANKMYTACDDKEYKSARGEKITLLAGLAMLADADLIVGHNIGRYDVPVLIKLYPEVDWLAILMFDTMLMSMIVWPDIKLADMGKTKAGYKLVPKGKLIGSYSLDAWGQRLGQYKGDYSDMMKAKGLDPWENWNPDQQRYCEQDVCVTVMLFERIKQRQFPADAARMEHDFMLLDQRREAFGFRFNEPQAVALYATLCDHRERLGVELRSLFKPWFAPGKLVTPRKTLNYKDTMRPDRVEGAQFVEITYKEFNPGNRYHVVDRLKTIWGWEPKEFNKGGSPKLDDQILSELDWPEALKLSEYYMVLKRIATLAEGAKSYLKFVKNGRMHGRITTVGAVTRRCTHHDPNLSQTPAVKVPYGPEFRDLFYVDDGYDMLGIDASGLELRCLAHYLHSFDGGAYAKAVVEGKEADGTDVHSLNARALGFDPKKLYVVNGKHTSGRDLAKRFIYAFLYGAGDYKIGLTVGLQEDDIEQLPITHLEAWAKAASTLKFKKLADTPTRRAMVVRGGLLKASFLFKTPALDKLRDQLATVLKHRNYIFTIDGAVMPIRHKHAVLNTLLQSTGAIVVKYATVALAKRLKEEGLVWGKDWAMVMHSHDEMQIQSLPEFTAKIGDAGCEEFRKAGEMLGFLCPLAGAWKHGKSWKDTH